jgi:hypothetical protein
VPDPAFARLALAALVLLTLPGCGGGSSSPQEPTAPTPTPTPTPEPAGAARLVSATLPVGSTVKVGVIGVTGQQTPQLSFTGAIMLRQGLNQALVRAWVRTDARRCMGGGQARIDFLAGIERGVAPASMSASGGAEGVCTLPYTTTYVEFEVFDVNTQRPVLEVRIPAVYNFVAE